MSSAEEPRNRTTDLHLTPLGDAGLAFITDSLQTGKSLSSVLLATVDFTQGGAFAFLPHDFDASRSWARARGMSSERSRELAAQLLAHAAVGQESPVCLFEDAEASPGDGWLSSARSLTLQIEDEVYHAARSVSVDDIRVAIDDAECSWSLIGVLAYPVLSWSGERTTLLEIKDVVDSTAVVVVSAFDGEGYVMWFRTGGAGELTSG